VGAPHLVAADVRSSVAHGSEAEVWIVEDNRIEAAHRSQ
jgi:hypothetical protein